MGPCVSAWVLSSLSLAPHSENRSDVFELTYAYVDYLQWEHGSTLTITLLLIKFKANHQLSAKLHLQMGSATQENKNMYCYFAHILCELESRY